MQIQLTSPLKHKGVDKKIGDVINVHPSLGNRLVGEGHKPYMRETPYDGSSCSSSVIVMSDEEVDAYSYQALKKLIVTLKIQTEDAKADTYKTALKSYFTSLKA